MQQLYKKAWIQYSLCAAIVFFNYELRMKPSSMPKKLSGYLFFFLALTSNAIIIKENFIHELILEIYLRIKNKNSIG